MQQREEHDIAIVILAAGASKRMSAIKQLLPWKQTTLINHCIEQSDGSNAQKVFVVLGANAAEILQNLNPKAQVVKNPNWEQGMGTSIARAIHYFEEKSLFFDAVLFALVDQPLLDSDYFNILINKYLNSNNNIIASQINEGAGVPVILSQIYFDNLKKLNQDYGAKRILTENWQDVLVVNSEEKNRDVDTMEAYEALYEAFGK